MSSELWDAYAHRQAQLSKVHRVNSRSWGLEAGLNRLLDSGEGSMAGHLADRAARSESRKERHHAELRRRHLSSEKRAGDHEVGHRPPMVAQRAMEGLSRVEEQLDSIHTLSVVARRLASKDLALLLAVAEGWDYDTLASTTMNKAGTLRVRVQRLRVALGAAAA